MSRITPLVLAGILATTPIALAAQDFGNAVKARQGQFRIISFNLGILGAMAKGETPYDAPAATQAAQNLVAVAALAQNSWPEGSDAMSIDGTRALPAIWEDTGDFVETWQTFGTAADGLAAVAGNGVEGLGPAMGTIGNTCKTCHETYREADS